MGLRIWRIETAEAFLALCRELELNRLQAAFAQGDLLGRA